MPEAFREKHEGGTLFIDVACDPEMGFEWARPTTFSEPLFDVGGGRFNYGVDHSPSLMWDSATWEISRVHDVSGQDS